MLKVDFRIYLYLYISESVILWSITIPNCCKNTQFLAEFSKMHLILQIGAPNFANWGHWVWNWNPPIDIPKIMKKHPKTFEYPHIPSTSQTPPPPGWTYLYASIPCEACWWQPAMHHGTYTLYPSSLNLAFEAMRGESDSASGHSFLSMLDISHLWSLNIFLMNFSTFKGSVMILVRSSSPE